MEYESQIEKVYVWAGQKLKGCPVRDGVTFYNHTEKMFKILRRRKGWYIEFSVPVPACPGLKVLTDEEAKTRKLGKTRWIYRGTSDQDAETLIRAAAERIPHRHIIDPAMPRETAFVAESSSPCLRKMEKLQESKNIPPEILRDLKAAYALLQAGRYSDFVSKIKEVLEAITIHVLQLHGISPAGDLAVRFRLLFDHKLLSRSMEEEIEEIANLNIFERKYEEQERAYPIALVLVSLTGKLIRLCH